MMIDLAVKFFHIKIENRKLFTYTYLRNLESDVK